MKKTVVVGVTSGIAAYKIIDLIYLLKRDGFNVIVTMTKSASLMLAPKEFEKASENKVYIDLFEENFDYKDVLKSRKVEHVRIADTADLVVIAPATANSIAKMSHGMADDFLTTVVLATQAPIMVCPSMNVHMWGNSFVQENVEKLKTKGICILEPTEGDLACGYHGKGRLPEPSTIYNEIKKILQKTTRLQGKKVIVTVGGTTEPIDDVRYITNKASGKMGVAIADECFLQGAEVLLVRSKTSVSSRYDIRQIVFGTADELEEILQKEVKKCDALFQTAAVSDFKVEKAIGKIPSDSKTTLRLTPRKKIIDQIKIWNSKIKLIAFKAVWGGTKEELIKQGQEKLQKSKADYVVVNDISKNDRGFGVDTNEAIIVSKNKPEFIPLCLKTQVALEIVNCIF